ncbi:MAG: hypothetical protein ACR2QJ_01290 [Geminicoccaceae bacterium]
MISNLIVLAVAIGAAAVLFSKRLQNSTDWQATVTPLASIIGSGFLVSVPLLAAEVGNWSILAMAALVGAAYLVGAAIRFNIRHAEPLFTKPAEGVEVQLTQSLERLSHFVLAFAYFISVAYYLVLLGNFLLSGFGSPYAVLAKVIATAILAALGSLGLFKGLAMVERVEKYAVGVNLAVIAALLGGLLWHNGATLAEGTWQFSSSGQGLSLHSIQVLLGLLIVVQGFETSRFMGDEYDADTRIRTMRYAQWIAAVVYIVFFALMTGLFRFLGKDTGITAIIGLVGHVALVLPIMLTIGAVASQFSASVADSVGCAGLLENIANKRLSLRHAYPLIAVVSIAIIWNTDVFRIITLASQAFALFYLVQCCVALSIAHEKRDLENRTGHMALFSAVAVFCLCVTLFGIPSGG